MATAIPFTQTTAQLNVFRAIAVNVSTVGRSGEGRVEIVVNRWSTEAECDRLLSTLREKGPEKLLSTLQDTKRVGYIRTPSSIGYDLHFARRTPGEDGGERIVLYHRRIGAPLDRCSRWPA